MSDGKSKLDQALDALEAKAGQSEASANSFLEKYRVLLSRLIQPELTKAAGTVNRRGHDAEVVQSESDPDILHLHVYRNQVTEPNHHSILAVQPVPSSNMLGFGALYHGRRSVEHLGDHALDTVTADLVDEKLAQFVSKALK